MENKKKFKKKRLDDSTEEFRPKAKKKQVKKEKYNHSKHWLDEPWEDQARM